MSEIIPILKIKLKRESSSNIVGGEFEMSGDQINRRMIIRITEDLGGFEGNFSTRILYDISLMYMSVSDLKRMLDTTGFFEIFLLNGPSDVPANFLEPLSSFSLSNEVSRGLVGFDWYNFGLHEEYLSYSSPYISDSDKLSFYLTSIDPSSEMLTTQRSFGKYINTTPFSDGAILLSKTSLYDYSMEADDLSELNNIKYIQINSEVISVESYSGNTISVDARAEHGTINQFHLNKDNIKFLDKNRVFNSSFGDGELGDFEQYRCIAVVNNSQMVLNNLELQSGDWSDIDKSKFSFFVEIPMVESFTATVISGGFSDFEIGEINESYLNMPIVNPENINPFLDQLVTFFDGENDGQQRIIVNYDIDTGMFSLNEDLPYQVSSGDTIRFNTSPSSTSYTGISDPRVSNNGIYSREIEFKDGQTLSISELGRSHGGRMLPGDVIYLWIKRSLAKSSVVSDEIPFLDFLYSVV
jgi:hypothetical protein